MQNYWTLVQYREIRVLAPESVIRYSRMNFVEGTRAAKDTLCLCIFPSPLSFVGS
jgi:hypothetical protein